MDRDRERADELNPEEQVAGVDDPEALAAAVLSDSDRRQSDRDAAPDAVVEHRTSDEVADQP